MPTFRGEIVQTGQNVEVDYTNPLSQYLSWAIVPSEGSGDSIKESVSGETASAPAGTLIWNSDGSVTGPDNTWIYRTKNYPQTFKEDALIFLDVSKHAPSSSLDSLFSRGDGTSNSKNEININVEKFSDQSLGFSLQMEFEGKGYILPSLDNTNTTPRTSLVLHWDASELKLKLYQNSQLVHESEVYTTSNERDMDVEMFCSLGGSAIKYYAGMYLQHPTGSFTLEEIESIVSDPYQLFRKKHQSVNDHALTGDGSGFASVSIPEALWSSGSANNPITHRLGYIASAIESDTRSSVILGTGTRHVLRHPPEQCTIGHHSVDLQSLGVDVYALNKFEIVRTFDGTTKSSKLYINDVFVEEVSPSSITLQSYNFLFKLNDTDFRKGRVKCIWQNDSRNPENNRFYDLNQANAQAYIPELLNGQHGELVGFPAPSGYVREVDSTKGIKFNGVNQYGAVEPTLLWGNGDSFAFEFDFFYTGEPNQSLAGDPEGFNNNILIESSTKIIVRMGNSSKAINLIAPLAVGRHSIAIKRNGFADFGAYDLDDNLLSEPMDPLGGALSLYGFGIQYNSGYFRQFKGVMYRARFYTDFNRTMLAHDWQFTKASGYSVPDEVGSLDIQLFNFDAARYRPEAGGNLIGYRFKKTSYADFNRFSWFSIEYNESCALEACFVYDANGERRYPITTNRNAWSNNQGIGIHENGNIIIGYGRHGGQVQISKSLVNVDNGDFLTVRVEIDQDLTSRVYFNGELVHTQTVSNIQSTEIARVGNWFELNNETYKPFDDTVRYVQTERSGVVTNYWDCSTGDADQIIDTVGGNHAQIVDASTTGYLPIVKRRVLTLSPNVGSDYNDINSFFSAEKSVNGSHPVLLVSGTNTVTTDSTLHMDVESEFPTGLTIKAVGGEYWGKTLPDGSRDLDKSGKATLVSSVKGNKIRWGVNGQTLNVEGLVLETTSPDSVAVISMNPYRSGHLNMLSSFVMQAGGGATNKAGLAVGSSNSATVKDSIIYGASSHGIESTGAGNAKVFNTMVVKCNQANSGYRHGIFNAKAVNCIAFDNGDSGKDFHNNAEGSANNISEDATGDIQLADIATAFADSAALDFRLKQSYADANLMGVGWNGSDIASWAYYDDSAGGGATPEDVVYNIRLNGMDGDYLATQFSLGKSFDIKLKEFQSSEVVSSQDADVDRVLSALPLTPTTTIQSQSQQKDLLLGLDTTIAPLSASKSFLLKDVTSTMKGVTASIEGHTLAIKAERVATLRGAELESSFGALYAQKNWLQTLKTVSGETSGVDASLTKDRTFNASGLLTKANGGNVGLTKDYAFDASGVLVRLDGVEANLTRDYAFNADGLAVTLNGVTMDLTLSELGIFTISLKGMAARSKTSKINTQIERAVKLAAFKGSEFGATIYVNVDRLLKAKGANLDGFVINESLLTERGVSLSGASISSFVDASSLLFDKQATLGAAYAQSYLYGLSMSSTAVMNLSKTNTITSYSVSFEASPVSVIYELTRGK